ncbi:hypothetical protein BU16DRAFT_542735 [Lophium mytilinum]|uniref:Uncharacterized protein n=1 Tax=Lophium mytilinum TaxID=390894 RepID=A0A6A6QIZ2_9PEZI|nr:hypothetical protein BU16DRAFT_542735 [Lophium mytilinum]
MRPTLALAAKSRSKKVVANNPFRLERPRLTTQNLNGPFDGIFNGFFKSIKAQNKSRRKLIVYDNVVDAFKDSVTEALGDSSQVHELVVQAAGNPGKTKWDTIMGKEFGWSDDDKTVRSGIKIPSMGAIFPPARNGSLKKSYTSWIRLLQRENPGVELTREVCDAELNCLHENISKGINTDTADSIKFVIRRLLSESAKYWAERDKASEE